MGLVVPQLARFFLTFLFLLLLEIAIYAGMGDPWPRDEEMAGPSHMNVGRKAIKDVGQSPDTNVGGPGPWGSRQG